LIATFYQALSPRVANRKQQNHGLLGGLMTSVVFSPRRRRRHGDESTRKCNVAIAFAYGPLLAALVACGFITEAHALSRVSAPSPRSDYAPATHSASLLAVTKRSEAQEFTSRFEYSYNSPIMNVRANALGDNTGGIPRLPFALSPPKPLVLTSLTLPASIEARIEQSDEWTPKMIVGIASMYNPADPNDRDSGDGQTASGEMYDGAAWTAAIRIDLRGQFGGVRYGRNYRPAYALVETGSKRAIIKINDVGPLAFGRIIDLNKRAMHYFDPSLRLGLIHDMRVIPLPGTNWTAGPIGNDGETIQLAGGFGP
jgi:rare lipoprotein A